MAPNEKAFDAIDGRPTYYWRYVDGVPRRATFYSTYGFYDQLVRWINDMQAVAGPNLGSVLSIVSAGVYVAKPGQHGLGQALDLDRMQFYHGTCTPYARVHASPERWIRRRYLAVDAVTRRWFRYTLDGWYNAAHADHIHMDFGGLPVRCVKSSRSDTVFVQSACNNFEDAGLAVDGIWGPLTQGAFDQSMQLLEVAGDPHSSSSVWQMWLYRAARHGFADRGFGYFDW
ncbi:MAG: extensin family protein [Acidimicrobiales bacterium]